jgi:hypothetical protein
MVVMVMLQNDPKRQFMTIEMRTNQQSTFPCNLVGDITENRANEIIKEKYDTTATIDNGILKFNGKEFKIISNQEIEEAISALIKKEKLNKRNRQTLRSLQRMKSNLSYLPKQNKVVNLIFYRNKRKRI